MEHSNFRFGKLRTAICQHVREEFQLQSCDSIEWTYERDEKGLKCRVSPVYKNTPPTAKKATSSTANYNNPEKNTVRERIWREIVTRLNVNVESALVLYLAGAQDLDRPVAVSLGFAPKNLIAIERDINVVNTLRKKRVLVIPGELSSVLRGWKPARPVHVVYADLSCGLDDEPKAFLPPLVNNPAFNQCVLAVNLLRGREKISKAETKGSRSSGFLNLLQSGLYDALAQHYGQKTAQALCAEEKAKLNPVEINYASGVLRFDCLVTRNTTVSGIVAHNRTFFPKPPAFERKQILDGVPKSTKDSMAAILAIRTQRGEAD